MVLTHFKMNKILYINYLYNLLLNNKNKKIIKLLLAAKTIIWTKTKTNFKNKMFKNKNIIL